MNSSVFKFKINKRLIRWFGEPLYPSYEAAMRDCVAQGYENEAIIQLIEQKATAYTTQLRQRPVTPHIENQNVFALLSLLQQLSTTRTVIRVIDFGGGGGGHYFDMRNLLDSKIKLHWTVVETTELAKVMQPFVTQELFFSDDLAKTIQNTPTIDLLYTAGTLQYTPAPYDFLKKMLDSGATYLFFNRQSLHRAETDLITVQRSLLSWHGSASTPITVPDTEIRYPHTNMSQVKFEKAIQQNYKILYTFDDASGVKVVNKAPIMGRSYVLIKGK